MSNPPMYGQLVPLDRERHRKLRLVADKPSIDRAAGLNSLFLAVAEFPDACKEYPIVFVRVGQEPTDGSKQAIAPLAVLGLKPGQNLFIKDGKWTGNYAPAYLRRYPFAMARIDDSEQVAVCFDSEWSGFSETEGTPLFNEDGTPSELTLNAKTFLESFEDESERTRAILQKLSDLDLFQDMRFQATLPSGEKIDVEGFLAINEEKYAKLDDAVVLDLFRSGLLSLLEMHRLSMGNMPRLAQILGEASAS
jgi:hypothetical protein